MRREIREKIIKTKELVCSLSAKINGQECITFWFKELCAILTDLLNSFTKYIKTNKGNIEPNTRSTILLNLTQMTASLSLLIKIFLKECEVNEVISEARYCISKQLTCCLDNLADLLLSGKGTDNSAGSFIKWMDAVLDKINEIDVETGSDNALGVCEDARPLIEEVLCHAMSIAQVALTEDCKIIKGSSQTVLDTLEALTLQICKPDLNVAMCNLFVDCCTDKLCILERKVNIAVLKLTLEIFSEYTKPLEKLQHYCFNSLEKSEDKLDTLIADFDLHVDRIMQIGLFAVACSTDSNRCIKMRSCLASLEALEGELVPALTAVSIDRSVHNIHFALLLKEYWIHQSKLLKELIYLIIDPSAFCQVTYDRLLQIVDDMSESMKNKNYVLSIQSIENLTCKADVLKDMIKVSISDISSENIEDIETKYKDFTSVLFEVKASANKLLTNSTGTREGSLRVLKRCKILLTVLGRLLKTLLESEGSNKQNADCHSTSGMKANSVLSDVTNNKSNIKDIEVNKPKIEDNSLMDQIANKGKQILKDRSILYKTPTKFSILKKITSDLTLAKSSDFPLSRLVHLKRLNFSTFKSRTNEGESLDLQITDILNELTSMSISVSK